MKLVTSMASLRFSRGETVYIVGRGTALVAQIALAAAATRLLGPDDLGRLATGIVVGGLPGAVLGVSARRLATQAAPDRDLSDLKLMIVLAGCAGGVLAGIGCWIAIDARTAIVTTIFAGWRAADGYLEIAFGVWARDGRLARAGVSTAIRNLLSVATAIVLLLWLDLILALLGGFLVRLGVAVLDVASVQSRGWRPVPMAQLLATARVAGRLSLVGGAVLAIEALPTLLLSTFGGITEAALLAPLGRVRGGLMLGATTISEVYFAPMVRAVGAGGNAMRFTPRAALQVAILTVAFGGALSAGGAVLLFGGKLVGETQLVLLAVAGGGMMGLATVVSAAATAERLISIQALGYALAVVVATLTVMIGGWTMTSFLTGQILGPVAAIVAIVILRARAVHGGDESLQAWSTPGRVESGRMG